jgi:methionyl-tRNA formyltransferase
LYKNEPFKIHQAEVVSLKGEAGTILESGDRLVVACGESALSLKKVQKSGGNAMNISDFLRGNKFTVGEKFV